MIPKLNGSHPWAVILCYPSDSPRTDLPGPDYFRQLLTRQYPAWLGGVFVANLDTWWRDISGDRLNLAGSVVVGWIALPLTTTQLRATDRGGQIAAAAAAAKAAGHDLAGYRHTLAVVAGSFDGGAYGPDVLLGMGPTAGQSGWRHCSKCQGLAYWDGTREPGHCVAGGRHNHKASGYYAVSIHAPFSGGQQGWRWCNKCEALIFESESAASCPGGNAHDLSQSGDYWLKLSEATGDGEQPDWRWCRKCQALAFSKGPNAPGPCPVSGRHDHTGSGNYKVRLAWAASLGWLAHETGHGFGLGHGMGTRRAGDIANDRSPGAYGDPTDVMSWANTAQFSVARYTPAGAGLTGPMLHKLGWLPDTGVTSITAPVSRLSRTQKTVTLGPLHGGLATTGKRMIRVIVPDQGYIYTAELRAPVGWDQGLDRPQVLVRSTPSLYQIGQDGWRKCSNCQGLIYAGQTACPAGGLHDGSASGDYGVAYNSGPAAGQGNWRWCSKCSGLFFGNDAGTCPGGGSHERSASGDYALPMTGPGQPDWRWCNKCQSLFFAGNGSAGSCAAGGAHSQQGSGAYYLQFGPDSRRQNGWRWCSKCQGLYFAAFGACQGHDVHRLEVDEDYAPVVGLTGAKGQAGWRFCSKCSAMAYADGSRPSGPCAAGGTHDHNGSGHYKMPIDTEGSAAQRNWRMCLNCNSLYFADPSREPGPCPDGPSHVPFGGLEYFVAPAGAGVAGETRFRWCRKCNGMVLADGPAACPGSGQHDTTGSGQYAVRTDPAWLGREQSFWRACSKCRALFAMNATGREKACAGGGMHVGSGEYFLSFVTAEMLWRWCNKCQGLVYAADAAGPCPSGAAHEYSGSAIYSPARFSGGPTQSVKALTTAGSTWTDPSKRVSFSLQSIDSANAVVRVTVDSSPP